MGKRRSPPDVISPPASSLATLAFACGALVLGCGSTDSPPGADTVVDAVIVETSGDTSDAVDVLRPPPPTGGLAFWYEDSDLAPLLAHMDALAEHSVEVNLALHDGEIDEAALRQLLEAAARAGVPFHIWPLLHPDDGYFASVRTAVPFRALWDGIVALLEDGPLPVSTLVVDLEPPLDVLVGFQSQIAETGDFLAAIDDLVARYDPVVFEAGRAELEAMVVDAQARGFRVVASTLFLVLDDAQDGDDDIQRAFDIPIDGLPWQEVSFQVYRTAFTDMLGGVLLDPGEVPGPFIVYDYARTAVERYPELAALDIGITGAHGYDPSELQADVAAARAAGLALDALNVYSLMPLVAEQPGPSPDWFDVHQLTPVVPEKDARIALLRTLIQGVDESISLGGR